MRLVQCCHQHDGLWLSCPAETVPLCPVRHKWERKNTEGWFGSLWLSFYTKQRLFAIKYRSGGVRRAARHPNPCCALLRGKFTSRAAEIGDIDLSPSRQRKMLDFELLLCHCCILCRSSSGGKCYSYFENPLRLCRHIGKKYSRFVF